MTIIHLAPSSPPCRTPDDAHQQVRRVRGACGPLSSSSSRYLAHLRADLLEWVADIDLELASRQEKDKRAGS